MGKAAILAQGLTAIDAYLARVPDATRDRGLALRDTIIAAVPKAVASIRYGMPAFHMGGRSYLYFAVWKRHVGLYPIYDLPGPLAVRVAPFHARVDTLQFVHHKPLPLDLIADLARYKRALALGDRSSEGV